MLTTRIVGVSVDGAEGPLTIARSELVITSAQGKELAQLANDDPVNEEVIRALWDAQTNRLTVEQKRRNNRREALACLGAACLSAFVIFAGANVYSMGDVDNERAKPSGDPIERVNQGASTEQTEFSDLTAYGENDVWNYIELYAETKNTSVIQALGIVTKANPGVDFHKIPKGTKIKVPSI